MTMTDQEAVEIYTDLGDDVVKERLERQSAYDRYDDLATFNSEHITELSARQLHVVGDLVAALGITFPGVTFVWRGAYGSPVIRRERAIEDRIRHMLQQE